jgi:microcompartment protein CcmK/EutM
MKVGRVAATVVSTICSPALAARRLLICDYLDSAGKSTGSSTIAVDTVGAGAGETVLIMDEGNSARQVLDEPEAPIRAVIVGIVDQLVVDGETIFDTGS